ncbi:TPA: restriction endonuclease subunit S [Neisseria weaveri]
MLESVEWGEFRMGDLFEIKTSKKRFDANKVTVLQVGKYPYVVRTSLNNGIKGYINEDVQFLNEGNTISFGQDTATVFYQEQPYFTGDKIKVIKPKIDFLTRRNAQFILSMMSKAFSAFAWGSSSFKVSILQNVKLELPTQNGQLNLDFMENFVAELEARRSAELEARRSAELEAYLSAAGLKDYTLTAEEQQALAQLEKGGISFKSFKVIDLFAVQNTFNILARDIVPDSGATPYLCASRENNAVSSYISHDEKLMNRGNCIFIGGKTFVVTYQANNFFSNDSHNLCLYFKGKNSLSKLQSFFMISCIEKGLGRRYSWGNSISNKKIQTDTFMLPENSDGTPDYAFMAVLMSAVQKIVIKDVVQYADKKIAATQSVIRKNNQTKHQADEAV